MTFRLFTAGQEDPLGIWTRPSELNDRDLWSLHFDGDPEPINAVLQERLSQVHQREQALQSHCQELPQLLTQNAAIVQPLTLAIDALNELGDQNNLQDLGDLTQNIAQISSPNWFFESTSNAQLIGKTEVGLNGVLTHEIEPCHPLHQSALQLALASRLACFRFYGAILSSAVQIATQFELPGGQWAALSATWTYLKDFANPKE